MLNERFSLLLSLNLWRQHASLFAFRDGRLWQKSVSLKLSATIYAFKVEVYDEAICSVEPFNSYSRAGLEIRTFKTIVPDF